MPFSFFFFRSDHVTCQCGSDSEILNTFPMEQTWPSILSVELGFARFDDKELPMATIW